jgi:hypothetical protein
MTVRREMAAWRATSHHPKFEVPKTSNFGPRPVPFLPRLTQNSKLLCPSRLSQPDKKVRFREDGREGIIDGLTKLLVLSDEDGVVLMVRQKGEYRRVVTQQRQTVFAA